MPENSFHKLLQHAMRQARSLCRAWRAWGFSCQDTADSWQSELQGTWRASLLGSRDKLEREAGLESGRLFEPGEEA